MRILTLDMDGQECGETETQSAYGFLVGGFGSDVAGTANGVIGFNGGGDATFASRSPAMSLRLATTR